MSDEIAVLRAMADDVSLPQEVRQGAMARLARLVPSAEDQMAQFVALLPQETVELLADWEALG